MAIVTTVVEEVDVAAEDAGKDETYTPEQWRKLSPEDKKKVYDGRQKSAKA
jgi:hypothetical protein